MMNCQILWYLIAKVDTYQYWEKLPMTPWRCLVFDTNSEDYNGYNDYVYVNTAQRTHDGQVISTGPLPKLLSQAKTQHVQPQDRL